MVAIGGDSEITVCGPDSYPVGVISTDPAYLMNSELTAGLPVALVGRVPVRIVGSVNKGQKVYADGIGRASKNVAIESSASPVSELQIERAQVERFIGIALENNADEGEKLVECILKV